MWKNASFALLFAILVSTASAQNARGVGVAASRATASGNNVLITMPIQIDGSVKDLQLLRGESYEDAAVTFARNNGLLNTADDARVREVVDQLSGLLRGRMEEIHAKEVAAPVTATESPKATVQLSFPLTINGVTTDIKKFEGETVEASVERYLYNGGYTMDVMRELYPQLVELVTQKLNELHPARKELFSFSLTIDGREAIARHFENGDPMEEARETVRSLGINDAAFAERIIPQIANEIRKQMPPPAPQAQPAAAQQVPPPVKELFSIPLTVNARPTVLVHYEGYTSRESAARYLKENGLGEDNQVMAQVIQIIDNRVAEIATQQAAEEAAAQRAKIAEQEEIARAAEEAARLAAQQQRQPAVRLPINFGNNQAATLEYYEGDSVERTVEAFLTRAIGLQEGPSFTQNVAQLSEAIRQEMKAVVAARTTQQDTPQTPQQQPEEQPLVTLPVTLSGRVFDLIYFAGQQPANVANTFCVEKHEIIRSELGLQFDGDQLLECKNLLEKTLQNMIAEKQQQAQAQTEEPAKPARGVYLLSLDIDINGSNVPLNVHQGDNVEQIARDFCDQHKVGLENVGPLVHAINEQLAQFK